MVLAAERSRDDSGSWWLCVRSTLPPDMTARAVAQLVGSGTSRPSRTDLAKYRGGEWASARLIGLGKRAIHPVVAGVLSYETGAGRNVDHAVTLDDRALHEAGHAIGVVATSPGSRERSQIGIAIDKRRVWQTGYVRLPEYAPWAAEICRDIEGGAPVGQLGGLRVADSPLDPAANPVAADFAPFFDANWDGEYDLDGVDPIPFSELAVTPLPRQNGADIDLSLTKNGAHVSTLTYAPDGKVLSAIGEFRRHGRSEGLQQRLERHPISIFFSDGSVMRGAGGCIAPLEDDQYFGISSEPAPLTENANGLSVDNRVIVLDPMTMLLPEKDGGSSATIFGPLSAARRASRPASLFQFVVRQAAVENADVVFCDDGSNEIADFLIGWRSYPRTSAPHLRLVHCKAMASAERSRLRAGGTRVQHCGLKEAEEVCQQTLRSVAFLLRPPDVMHAQLAKRSEREPKRWIAGTLDAFKAIMSVDPIRRTAEVWAVHPGMSRTRLMEPRGRALRSLLSAVRVRAVDARADLALLGRP